MDRSLLPSKDEMKDEGFVGLTKENGLPEKRSADRQVFTVLIGMADRSAWSQVVSWIGEQDGDKWEVSRRSHVNWKHFLFLWPFFLFAAEEKAL